ncbi:MAG: dihydropteroate synthase [Flavobacteriales bacterium]
MTLNCRGSLIDLTRRHAMAIVNLTPDSFYDGGKLKSDKDLLQRVETDLEAGATFLDLGGYSSRPGATDICETVETARVIQAIVTVKREFPEALISIDTFRAAIAEKAVHAGACLINDISGGSRDKNMFQTVAKLRVPYIVMHMRGTPQTMQSLTGYKNLIQAVNLYFSERVNRLNALGVNDIILDPGFGFAKTTAQNYALLKNLSLLYYNELPILVGISRKSMVYKPLHSNADRALNATTAAHTLALQRGAAILRVHDVSEAMEAIKIFEAFESAGSLA